MSRWIVLSCLCSCLWSLTACRRSTGSFRKERIPTGTTWQCWLGRCSRDCGALPGPADATGSAPEPTCARPETAFCITFEMGKTYVLEREPHWECFDLQQSCEGNRRHYIEEAENDRDYALVSPCTELR